MNEFEFDRKMRAQQLRIAITNMAVRYGEAQSDYWTAVAQGNGAGCVRFRRSAIRRLKALQRLAGALANLALTPTTPEG